MTTTNITNTMVILQNQRCCVGKQSRKTLLSLWKHVCEEKRIEKMIHASVIGI